MAAPLDASAASAAAAALAEAVSALEPLCAIAFAINVAYLGLHRFRHLVEISADAERELQLLAGGSKAFDSLPESIKALEPYKILNDLRSIRVKYERSEVSAALDRGFSAWLYRTMYRRQIDRFAAGFFTFISVFVLISGVGLEVGALPFVDFVFRKDSIVFWFYAIVVTGALPVLFAFLGARVVEGRRNQAKHCREEIEKTIQIAGQNLKVDLEVLNAGGGGL